MALTDLVLSVIPEAYRRDVMVLAIGATAATGWWHFESRIDTAYAAAVTTQQQQVQLQQLTANQKLIEAQSATKTAKKK